jgi:hypothetical protein
MIELEGATRGWLRADPLPLAMEPISQFSKDPVCRLTIGSIQQSESGVGRQWHPASQIADL